MSLRRCCVPGCDNKTSPRYAIPKNEHVQQIWITRIGNEKLRGIDDHSVLKNYTVCMDHFHATCLNPDKRLMIYAIPSVHLPGYTGEVENCFYRPETAPTKKFVTPQKIRESLKESASKDVEMEGKTDIPNVKRTYLSRGQKRKLFTDDSAPSTADEPSTSSSRVVQEPLVQIPLSHENVDLPPNVDRYVQIRPKAKKRGVLHAIGVSRQKNLTPKEKQLYLMIKKLTKITENEKVRKMSAHRKLQLLSKKEPLFQKLNINEITFNFFQSQMKTQKHSVRGRRFTLKDKILALSIYKQSGKCYRFLSKIFSLPSRKTLMAILNRIPFNCGINDAIFNHLKAVIENMRANQDPLTSLAYKKYCKKRKSQRSNYN